MTVSNLYSGIGVGSAAGGDLSGTYPNPAVSKTSGGSIGFMGTAPVAKTAAYTLTFATTGRTLPADTAANVATTGSTNVTPFGYTTSAQADAIPVAINAIRVDLDSAKAVLKQLIADLQSYGLLQ